MNIRIFALGLFLTLVAEMALADGHDSSWAKSQTELPSWAPGGKINIRLSDGNSYSFNSETHKIVTRESGRKFAKKLQALYTKINNLESSNKSLRADNKSKSDEIEQLKKEIEELKIAWEECSAGVQIMGRDLDLSRSREGAGPNRISVLGGIGPDGLEVSDDTVTQKTAILFGVQFQRSLTKHWNLGLAGVSGTDFLVTSFAVFGSVGYDF